MKTSVAEESTPQESSQYSEHQDTFRKNLDEEQKISKAEKGPSIIEEVTEENKTSALNSHEKTPAPTSTLDVIISSALEENKVPPQTENESTKVAAAPQIKINLDKISGALKQELQQKMGAENLEFIQVATKPEDEYGDEYYDEEDPENGEQPV